MCLDQTSTIGDAMPLHRTDKAVIGARVRALRNSVGEIQQFVPTDEEQSQTELNNRLAEVDKYLRDRRRSETQRRA